MTGTVAGAAQDDAVSEHASLDRRHAEFLDAVEPILTDTERRVFRELRHAYQRDAFIQRFWAVRDPFPETPMNEFREQFDAAVEVAEERFGGVRDARFEAWLLHGKPLRTFRTTCDLLRPLDVWHYPHSPAVRGDARVATEGWVGRAGAYISAASLARAAATPERGHASCE